MEEVETKAEVVETRVESRIRSLKRKNEENSKIIEAAVEQLVTKYNRDLDKFLENAKNLIDNKDRLDDHEIEKITLQVPIYMYFGVSGVETLGIQMDAAKTMKMEAFNDLYMAIEGTIGDKTSFAENSSITEHMLVTVYERAYKKLKTKMDVADNICQAARKVLTKRIAEIEISKKEPNYFKGERTRVEIDD